MKKRSFVVAAITAIVLTFITTGCSLGPWYGNKAEYEAGTFKGIANQGDMARYTRDRLTEKKSNIALSRDQMALDKLQAQPVKTGVMTRGGAVPTQSTEGKIEVTGPTAGYYGVIANMSPYQGRRYLFKYWGPETGVFYLKSGEKKPHYLLPGDYYGEIYYGGHRTGWVNFKSEPQEKYFDGEKVHWMFYAEY